MICIACENEHQENFCPNCGERAGIPKITFKSMFAEAFKTVTNMDKGFLLNLKYLTLSPKQLIGNYLSGKRKGIYNPISFLILAVTIYLIVDSLIEIPKGNILSDSNNKDIIKTFRIYSIGYEAGYFIQTYLKYFWLLTIFWLGLATKIMFGKYNYAEHLTICSFTIGYATLVGLIGFLTFTWDDLLYNPFVYVAIIWILYQVFKNEKDKSGSFVQVLVAIMLFVLQLFILALCIGVLRT